MDVFLSYARGVDANSAKAIAESIERIGRPWLGVLLPKKRPRVFLDQRDSHASPDLHETIFKAMDRCSWFVLLASPRSATRGGVEKEIDYWQAVDKRNPILIVRLEGIISWDNANADFDWTATDALSKHNFSKYYGQEPAYADIGSRDDSIEAAGLTLQDSRFLDAIATVSAPVYQQLGITTNKANLLDRYHGEARKWSVILSVMIGSIIFAVLLAVFTSIDSVRSKRRADESSANRYLLEAATALESQHYHRAAHYFAKSLDISPDKNQKRRAQIALENIWAQSWRPMQIISTGDGENTRRGFVHESDKLLVNGVEKAFLFDLGTMAIKEWHLDSPGPLNRIMEIGGYSPNGSRIVGWDNNGVIASWPAVVPQSSQHIALLDFGEWALVQIAAEDPHNPMYLGRQGFSPSDQLLSTNPEYVASHQAHDFWFHNKIRGAKFVDDETIISWGGDSGSSILLLHEHGSKQLNLDGFVFDALRIDNDQFMLIMLRESIHRSEAMVMKINALGNVSHQITVPARELVGVATLSSNHVLLVESNRISAWDVITEDRIFQHVSPNRIDISGAEVSSDGQHIAVWGADQVYVIEAENGEIFGTMKTHEGVIGARYLSEQKLLLSWDQAGVIMRSSYTTKPRTLPNLTHNNAVFGMSAPLQRNRILSWSYDGTIRQWDTQNYNKLPLTHVHWWIVNSWRDRYIFFEFRGWCCGNYSTSWAIGRRLVDEYAGGF